ncbi:Fe-S cluster biogenesis protein NfuA [Streptomyces sp. B3I7]|uniref:NifU family protein n=1 Tax=Streptomyces sp. B3I7 TaxID=3042269 RepID=UPI0027824265|nr:NifU family protein [Streptomyces sp. B3I7]MDQ0809247.1 Fe-S cluster biogenesis protein NfuA [Streptomyces sp. B3I7]
MAEHTTAAYGPGGDRLDDSAVEDRLTRIDDLLGRVEEAPGPTAQAAVEAVGALTEVYGEGLARILDLADEALVARLAEDRLLGHLMVLHDIHPDPVERRAERAVDGLRTIVRESGGEIELTGIDDGVARVRLDVKGCGSTAAVLETAVREALLAAAPELSGVERVRDPERDAAFVPLDTLTLRPAEPQGSP